jgi:hypothetical protein
MKKIKYFMVFLLLALVFSSCEEENHVLGDLNTPSNLNVSTEIVGSDAANPFGDGSGIVNFTVTGSDVLSYKFIYNGAETLAVNGKTTYTFGTTGKHKYTVTVVAYGAGGLSSSKTVEVEVDVKYAPPADLLTMLTSDSSRTWRIKSEAVGHFGVGPADAATSIWWSAPPLAKDGKGAYDDRFVFNVNGSFTHTTNGTAYGQKGPMTADLGGDQGLTANSDGEFENYPLANYTEGWALSAPGGQETLTFSNKGYHGFYVGGNHSYTILSRTANEMLLRTVGADGNGWFVIFIAE